MPVADIASVIGSHVTAIWNSTNTFGRPIFIIMTFAMTNESEVKFRTTIVALTFYEMNSN